MIIKKLVISIALIALSASYIASGVPANAADASSVNTANTSPSNSADASSVNSADASSVNSADASSAEAVDTSPVRAVESSNSYYAYPTKEISRMSVVRVGGKDYTLPLTMEQLAADGWVKPILTKAKTGELFVVNRGDEQLSISEDGQGKIERIVELYTSPGTLVIPGNGDIQSDISELDLLSSLDQMPLSWESSHLKNGTIKYKLLVPLGITPTAEEAETSGSAANEVPASGSATGKPSGSAAGLASGSAKAEETETSQGYPAFEYIITVSDQLVKAIEVHMISDPGSDGWPNEVLGFIVASYYEKQTGELPPLFRIEEQHDGRVLVRLFEDLDDHVATWALYKTDRTGKGYDEAFDPDEKKLIDFMDR